MDKLCIGCKYRVQKEGNKYNYYCSNKWVHSTINIPKDMTPSCLYARSYGVYWECKEYKSENNN